MDWGSHHLVSLGDKHVYEPGYFVDPDFLKMFSFELLQGDSAALLTDPTSLVITDEMARKFFGTENALGKTLKVDNDRLMTVKGIVRKPPENSSIKFSWLASYKIYEQRNEWLAFWGNNGIRTYLQLHEQADPALVNKKLYNYIYEKDSSTLAKPFLFSISDWRLRREFEEGKQTWVDGLNM
jgi:putative ABC transport system permease protein